MNRGRWLLLAAMLLAAVLLAAYGPDEQAVIRQSAAWRAEAHDHLPTALAVFFVAEVVIVGLSIPVGIWLTVLAGFLFGRWVGTAVASVASTGGAVAVFLAARYVFADPLRRAAASRPRLGRALAAVDRGFRDHGAYYIVLLRLTPVVPFSVLNVVLGLTPVRLRDYWWATQLGVVPVTFAVCNAGASLAEITSFRELLAPDVLLALGLMPLVPVALHHTVGRTLARPAPRG